MSTVAAPAGVVKPDYGRGPLVLRPLTAVVVVTLACAGAAGAAGARGEALPPLPEGWPHTLQLGLSDAPGGAAALRRSAPFGFRYQYLAGGVNTGHGWSTWNPDGTFASMYAADSWRHGEIPVLTYYQLLQSAPSGGGEAHADLANLRDPSTMAAYWNDVRLLFSRIRGPKPVVVHVEPDLWGYLEQANAVAIDGNTRPSLSADDDGGYFRAQARSYYRAGSLALPQ